MSREQVKDLLNRMAMIETRGGVSTKCKKFKEVPSKFGHPVRRCETYGSALTGGAEIGGAYVAGSRPKKGIRHCVSQESVYSPALKESVLRCKKFAPGGGCMRCCADVMGGIYRDRGTVANYDNKWQNFLREFTRLHGSQFYKNRPALLQAASEQYRQMG